MDRDSRDSDWTDLTDALLRGAAHALSNRTGALTAIRELGAMDEQGRELFSGEIERLTRLVHLLRLLPAEPAALPEALDVGALASEAVAVFTLHPDARELRWVARVEGEPQPVRAVRWVLLRCLLLSCAGALTDSLARGAHELHVITSGDAETTTVSLAGGRGEPASERAPGSYARELAERMGGELSRHGAGLTLRLPTVTAVRAREGRASSRDR